VRLRSKCSLFNDLEAKKLWGNTKLASISSDKDKLKSLTLCFKTEDIKEVTLISSRVYSNKEC